MNRSLVISAGCSLFAFATLLALLYGAAGREIAAEPAKLGVRWPGGDRGTLLSPRTDSESGAPPANAKMLSAEEAEEVLTTLTGEYLRPWRQWETSPRHFYSRAAPRPIPTIYAEIEISPDATGQSDSYLVATIAVSTGAQTQTVPCVINRITEQVRLFADGQWLTEDEWLKQAPLP